MYTGDKVNDFMLVELTGKPRATGSTGLWNGQAY